MKIVANFLLVVGVCLAAVGTAGFHDPAETGREPDGDVAAEQAAEREAGALVRALTITEDQAWPLFGVGMAIIVVGGFMERGARKAAASGGAHGTPTNELIAMLLARIRDDVAAIDDQKEQLTRAQLCDRIDEIIKGDFFDLVDKHEDFMQLVGFTNYARVWDHVAHGERLLARVWSIATDGHVAEALEDLPRARQYLEQAVQEMNLLKDSV